MKINETPEEKRQGTDLLVRISKFYVGSVKIN